VRRRATRTSPWRAARTWSSSSSAPDELLDELLLHVVPVLTCAGTRLFDNLGTDHIEWEKVSVVDSPEVTHIHLRALKRATG
jgi:dihydrofolate reductase